MIPRRTTSIDKTPMLNGNFTQHDTTVGASHINKHAAPETLRVSMTSQVDYKFIDKHVQPWGGDPSAVAKHAQFFKLIPTAIFSSRLWLFFIVVVPWRPGGIIGHCNRHDHTTTTTNNHK